MFCRPELEYAAPTRGKDGGAAVADGAPELNL